MSAGRAWGSVWVASTCSTSLVPIPKASAPNAPCVLVCESPQTMVMPGWVRPSCGPMTWTMPWLGEPRPWSGMPNSRQFVSSWATWAAASSSMIGRLRGVVGTEWSAVATVRSGWRTPMPRRRRPVKACGLVTSCTRWRSMASTLGAPWPSVTTWSSQILSTRVRCLAMAAHSARIAPSGSTTAERRRRTDYDHRDERMALSYACRKYNQLHPSGPPRGWRRRGRPAGVRAVAKGSLGMAAEGGRGRLPAIAVRARQRLVGAGTRMPAAHRILLFVVLLTAAAVAIFMFALRGRSAPFGAVPLPWPLLAAGFAIAEMKVVSVHFRRETHSFSLSEFPAVIGLFFLSPIEYLVALILGAGVALVVAERQAPAKLAF